MALARVLARAIPETALFRAKPQVFPGRWRTAYSAGQAPLANTTIEYKTFRRRLDCVSPTIRLAKGRIAVKSRARKPSDIDYSNAVVLHGVFGPANFLPPGRADTHG